jgi:hypothetical protein
MDPLHSLPREKREALSDVLRELCADGSDETLITIGEIVQRFGRRAFGALLFIFAIPNALPLPPGSSSILGLPLILLAPQVAVGVRRPWLPKFIDRRHVKASDLQRMLGAIIPRLEAVEKLSRPRLTFMFGPVGDRVIGVVCTLLALVLILPIPLGNLAPAICVGALALALFQRDGLIAIFGYLICALSVGLLVVSAGAVMMTVQKLITMLGF